MRSGDTDPDLLAALKALGDRFGPLGVAIVAASMTDRDALIRCTDPRRVRRLVGDTGAVVPVGLGGKGRRGVRVAGWWCQIVAWSLGYLAFISGTWWLLWPARAGGVNENGGRGHLAWPRCDRRVVWGREPPIRGVTLGHNGKCCRKHYRGSEGVMAADGTEADGERNGAGERAFRRAADGRDGDGAGTGPDPGGESVRPPESWGAPIFSSTGVNAGIRPGAMVRAGGRVRRWMAVAGGVVILVLAGVVPAVVTTSGPAAGVAPRPVVAAASGSGTAPPTRLARGCQRVVLAQNSGQGPTDQLVICYGMKKLNDAHWQCIVNGGPLVNNAVIMCYPVPDP